MRGWLVAAALLLGPAAAWAADPAPADPVAWLQRIATAARSLNYTGTFVYQHGTRVETSRIVHYVDATGNELERLEGLDGPMREVIRSNDEVKCYKPDSRTVWIEKRQARKSFPALLPEPVSSLAGTYDVRLGGQERVAGLDCQMLLLEPKDDKRYRHRMWVDTASGLLVKTAMLDDKGQVVEQFAFTQLTIGGPIDREQLKPHAAAGREWREERQVDPVAADTGWAIGNQPPGFKKVMEMKRSLPGKSAPVTQIVISDGLVAVSVFIEPLPPGDKFRFGISSQGAINVFTRPVADHLVTVLGEAPAVTVMQIGNSVSYKGGKP
ncbi:MAG TPA: MucB/RseB C-terminal domain-containing protein [Burkholderiales bacterium]|nr:MucB/RseB C-terminal domain-containing protein [Burkholderiales bacterium]